MRRVSGVRLALFGLGAGLLVYLVAQVEPGTLAAAFRRMSWGFGLIAWFPFLLIALADTVGWRYAFRRDDMAPFPALVGARLAGEAFNLVTPTATMGGEPMKAYLLRPAVPLVDGLASVIVAKTTIAAGQVLFLVVGLGLALVYLPWSSGLLHGMIGLALFQTVSVGGLVVLQHLDLGRRGAAWLGRLGLRMPGDQAAGLARVDTALAAFYRDARGRLGWSVAWHFVGWVLGSLEVYLILHFLGVPVSLGTAILIEAFVTAIKSAAFVVPASLGTQEGGTMLVFAALGLGGAAGLSVSLIRRVREFLWVGLGLLMLAWLRPPAAKAAAP